MYLPTFRPLFPTSHAYYTRLRQSNSSTYALCLAGTHLDPDTIRPSCFETNQEQTLSHQKRKWMNLEAK